MLKTITGSHGRNMQCSITQVLLWHGRKKLITNRKDLVPVRINCEINGTIIYLELWRNLLLWHFARYNEYDDSCCKHDRIVKVSALLSGVKKLATLTLSFSLLRIVVSPNEGTLNIWKIRSNKGTFPLFIRFPFFSNFDKIPPKSPKPRTEIGFSDHIA